MNTFLYQGLLFKVAPCHKDFEVFKGLGVMSKRSGRIAIAVQVYEVGDHRAKTSIDWVLSILAQAAVRARFQETRPFAGMTTVIQLLPDV
ncbi:MAG: hypothetical protein WCF84_16130 [Anaerolineae bacterium]